MRKIQVSDFWDLELSEWVCTSFFVRGRRRWIRLIGAQLEIKKILVHNIE